MSSSKDVRSLAWSEHNHAWRCIPEVEQFVECTVLLQLRDLLKSFNDECFPVNVQRCLNAHFQTCMLHLPGKHSQIVLSLVVCSVLSCRLFQDGDWLVLCLYNCVSLYLLARILFFCLYILEGCVLILKYINIL